MSRHRAEREPRRLSDRTAFLSRPGVLVFAALLAGFGVARWLEFRSSTVWTGRLLAVEGVARAPQNGRLHQLTAQPGVIAEAGQLLATVMDESTDRRRQHLEQSVVGLEQELAQAKGRCEIDLTWRLNAIETERHDIRLKQATYLQQKFDKELEQRSLSERLGLPSTEDAPTARIAPLRFDVNAASEGEDDLVSLRLRREAAVNAIEVAEAQVQLCDRRLAQLESLTADLPAQARRAAGVEAIESRLAAARAELAQCAAAGTTHPVRAPEYGTVGRWSKREGDAVTAGEPLVTLFDEDRRYVQVQIPSQRLAEFAEGTKVSLTFPGNIKRKGVVGPLPRQTNDATAETLSASESAGLVSIRIDSVDRLWPDAPIGAAIGVRVAR